MNESNRTTSFSLSELKDGSYKIVPFSLSKLIEILVEKTETSKELIVTKNHIKYFEEYFTRLVTKTIIVENKYVDRDYLEDYAAYYVRCFYTYPKTCTRLHFFTKTFSHEDFENILKGKPIGFNFNDLNTSYLGFIVIKPLPMTIVGRTCLKTYPQEGRRNYPIIRKYNSNLFGLNLTVDSLAFQEQDSVVAACATSALWSAFHGTGMLFHHPIPSPVTITEEASQKIPSLTRILPNNGLLIEQMVQAIRNVGLEPYYKSAENYFILKSTIYAYIKAKIPVVLVIILAKKFTRPKVGKGNKLPLYLDLGKHAVAVTGFSLIKTPKISSDNGGFRSITSAIDKIYVHDDQVGPFARMIFDEKEISVLNLKIKKEERFISLSTSWRDTDGNYGNIRAIPEIMLIPLYHKIRIPFAVIQDATIRFNALLITIINQGFMPIRDLLVWDIYLTNTSDLKHEILNSLEIEEKKKLELLTYSMPKYIWRSTGLDGDKKIIDLFFDATDIEQGHFFISAIEYDPDFSLVLREICNDNSLKYKYGDKPEWKIIEWFRSKNM